MPEIETGLPDEAGLPPEPEGTHAPSDTTTLMEVLARYQSSGFDTQLAPREGGIVHCFGCGTETPARSLHLVSLRRMEGASDPADMIAVAAVRCPSCGRGGLLTLPYGPEADADDAEVLLALQDHRLDEDELPAGAAPGETGETPIAGDRP